MKRLAAAAILLGALGLALAATPAPPSPVVSGEVLESQNVDSYTYVKLKTSDGVVWAAVPRADLKTGSRVTIGGATTMENFESKALKRRFDRILFGAIVETGTSPAMPHAPAAPIAGPMAVVPKATGPDARTVAEVVNNRASLKDRRVIVRGQVVKVSLGILGKNWLHLQDGSGSRSDGSHDVLVTTRDTVAVGSIVNAAGTVRTDVDLGSGYVYVVLIEDAAVRE